MSSAQFCLLFAVLLLPTATYGQSALDGFNPNANGAIRVVFVQPDGKILIGGAFTTLAPNGGPTITRNHIARLNPDGTVDTSFDPNANDVVRAFAVQTDGKILVGGQFNGPNSIGGQSRNRIARLDPVTGAADSFDPNANDIVFAIAIQPDGKVLVGGDFNGPNSIAGQTRNHIARLDPTTGAADSFDANADGRVLSIVRQSDGKILTGGQFHLIGGQNRNRIARLDAMSGLADSFDPNAENAVYAIAIQADGKILAGGYFNGPNSIGGQDRSHIARLDPVTGAADSFNPDADARVISIAVQPDGRILAGGDFLGIGGQSRQHAARLDPITGLADSLDQSLNSIRVYSIAVQSDGKSLIGGENGIVRLEIDGRVDQTIAGLNEAGSYIYALAVQPDGKILIGGSFSQILGVTRNYIARLNTDGSLDTAFVPDAHDVVSAIAIQPDGKILVQVGSSVTRLDGNRGLQDSFNPNPNVSIGGFESQPDGEILVAGNFTSVGGQARKYIARLDPVTGLADSFTSNSDGNYVSRVAVGADGKIIAIGDFGNIGGQARKFIGRLDPVTGLADSFNAHMSGIWNASVMAFGLQSNGKLLVSGNFLSIGGQPRNYMARLDATTGNADSFDSVFNDYALSIGVQADGKVIAGGYFTYISNYVRNQIARVDGTTGVPDAFDPNATNPVYAVAEQSDGKILASLQTTPPGGNIGGQARKMFARLSNDTAALQNLSVTRDNIIWTRGGSSPQLARTTFEYSTDRVHYILLGTGTAAGVNWQLSGLNLPAGQNIYVRARGFYRTGILNNSESIAESVRNAFLREVQMTNVESRKIHGDTPFDISLPIEGSGVECRGTGDGNYQIVFSFANPLMNVGKASVTSGTGVVNSQMVDSDAHKCIVNLTGVTNAQSLTVVLTNVDDSMGGSSASIPITFKILQGDTNGDGSVNSADIGLTKSKSGQTVDATNFRADVNADGALNSADISLVKGRSGTGLPFQTLFERSDR